MDRNDPSFSCWYTYSILARAAPSGPLQPYSRRAQNIYHRPKIRPEVAHRIFRPAPKQTGQPAAGFARARQTPRRRQQLAGLFNAWKAAREQLTCLPPPTPGFTSPRGHPPARAPDCRSSCYPKSMLPRAPRRTPHSHATSCCEGQQLTAKPSMRCVCTIRFD